MNARQNSTRSAIAGVALILGALVTLLIANGIARADGPFPRPSFGPFGGMMADGGQAA